MQPIGRKFNQFAGKHAVPSEDILFSPNDKIIRVVDRDNSDKKVILFDECVCEINQNDIIHGRQKKMCIYLSQSYYETPRK